MIRAAIPKSSGLPTLETKVKRLRQEIDSHPVIPRFSQISSAPVDSGQIYCLLNIPIAFIVRVADPIGSFSETFAVISD